MEKLVRLSREGSPNSLRLTPKSLRELLGEGEIWAISNLLLDSELLLLGLRGGCGRAHRGKSWGSALSPAFAHR